MNGTNMPKSSLASSGTLDSISGDKYSPRGTHRRQARHAIDAGKLALRDPREGGVKLDHANAMLKPLCEQI
jgi:hypothetical protein